MQADNFVLIDHYCEYTQTPVDFIYSLEEYGLIEIKKIESNVYVESHDIVEIERIGRLQNDLGINLEGIDALNHMIQKLDQLEYELKLVKNRLKIYEP